MKTTTRIIASSTAAILTAGLLTPIAHAQENITLEGNATWGVKASFSKYIKSPIAKGSITPGDNATWADAVLNMPLDSEGTTVTAKDQGVLDFDGSVHFQGHSGQLDLTFSDFKVNVNGNTGTLTVDYASLPYVPDAKMEYGQDQVLADLTFEGDVDLTKPGTLKANSKLASTGVAVFAGFYKVGDVLDPININLTNVDIAEVPEETTAPEEATTSVEPTAPEETTTSVEPTKPSEPAKPTEPSKPSTTPNPTSPSTPAATENAQEGSSVDQTIDDIKKKGFFGTIISILSSVLGVGAIGAALVAIAKHLGWVR
ncbi:hypothetical protein HCH15_02295 [Corynebacterium testudinoris]|uniref:Htaa protein n=1 Tax=Corynebacterium testudinoris TaxID=136857 RepID=A0A0G3H6T5_9CORY|nr:HtaA domain-containing protein [Corynebacterium testudinoris]AKK07553.1 Htaa protein [Corynebacterium testudinoris]MBX8995016.1 hypothetical protein [Corynebacterium testudinoris]